ncbi:MAG: glycosyltransferase family 39 protein [Acidobacteriaceae bacterium]|nr:glycosyltransferase family 39 protein [Acidobacteriaceae bacterium]
MWAFLRALDRAEQRPQLWAAVMAASIGTGLLLKGLIAAVFPIMSAIVYLGFSGEFRSRESWRRLQIGTGILIALAIAAPWHILATLRNPPYLYWSLKSAPGEYHGFFWFYFINEHVLRFLNLRYPHDYNTVPRLYFWLFHLLWLFPWSVFLPQLLRLSYKPSTREGQTRLLALCWTGFILLFFTFSSTQEYYSMPCYPALALLLGCAIAGPQTRAVRVEKYILFAIAAAACAAIVFILTQVWNLPTPGDIAQALTQDPDAYTLSLGHMGDLTLASFAYLRVPLMMAGVALLIGAGGILLLRGARAYFAIAAMMVLFYQAARVALVTFDPYLSSRPLAEALLKAPPGKLIEDDAYYTFSSVFFYTNRTALLLNGRKTNLEYGSYAPGAPHVFIGDTDLQRLWPSADRYYLLVEGPSVARIESLVGKDALHVIAASGGKFLMSNHARAD